MANSPWGSGPGKGSGGDDKATIQAMARSDGPRNPVADNRSRIDGASRWQTARPLGARRAFEARTRLGRLWRWWFRWAACQFNARRFGQAVELGPGRLSAVLWIAFSSFHVVPPEKEGVVTRLGQLFAHRRSGRQSSLCHHPLNASRWKMCAQIRTMDIGSPNAADENFVLTRDQSIVDHCLWRALVDPRPRIVHLPARRPRRHHPRGRRKRDARHRRQFQR